MVCLLVTELFPFSSQGLHSASVPGILSLDISPDSQHVVTGGNDKNVIVFDHSSEKVNIVLVSIWEWWGSDGDLGVVMVVKVIWEW